MDDEMQAGMMGWGLGIRKVHCQTLVVCLQT